MNRILPRSIGILALTGLFVVAAHAKPPKKTSCPAGKVLVLGKCFDPCPDGYAHDSQGKCTLCAAGYEKNPKTGACEKTAG